MILTTKYRSAMEKITVTPQMEERILTKLHDIKESERKRKKQQNLKRFRPVFAAAACCAIIICAMAIYPLFKISLGNWQIQVPQPTPGSGTTSVLLPSNSGKSEAQQGASPSEPTGSLSSAGDNTESEVTGGNPIVDTNGIEELKKSLPFQLMIPEKIPTGYKINSTSIISGELAQIIYSDGENQITYRAAKGSNDISGDNTSYPESDNTKMGDIMVKLDGSNSLVNLATWTKDGCSYSLTFSAGMAKKAVTSIIESVKRA